MYPFCSVHLPFKLRSHDCHQKPIHAPGAVQGFGVLIAVEEDDNTGNLVVRQVSEVSSLLPSAESLLENSRR